MSSDPRCRCPNPPQDCHADCPTHGISSVAPVPLRLLGYLPGYLPVVQDTPASFSPTIRYGADVHCSKLTITRDRVELKLTEEARDQENDYLRLAHIVVTEVGVPEFSLRGKFYTAIPGRLRISMYYDSRRELWGTREIIVAGTTPSLAYARTLVEELVRRLKRVGHAWAQHETNTQRLLLEACLLETLNCVGLDEGRLQQLQCAVDRCTDPQARATAEYMLRVAQDLQEP